MILWVIFPTLDDYMVVNEHVRVFVSISLRLIWYNIIFLQAKFENLKKYLTPV